MAYAEAQRSAQKEHTLNMHNRAKLSLTGLLLYLRCLSPLLLPRWERKVQETGAILKKTQAYAKKVPENTKKLFQNRRE